MKKHMTLCLAVLALATGCLGDMPTEPAVTVAAEPLVVKASVEEVAAFVQIMGDVTDRLIPSLIDQELAAPLSVHLTSLTSAMTARDRIAARTALTHAMELLGAYQVRHGAQAQDFADLAAIHLNMLVADSLIGYDAD